MVGEEGPEGRGCRPPTPVDDDLPVTDQGPSGLSSGTVAPEADEDSDSRGEVPFGTSGPFKDGSVGRGVCRVGVSRLAGRGPRLWGVPRTKSDAQRDTSVARED